MVIITSVQSNLARGRIALLSCHPSRRQTHSFAVCAGQAHSPCLCRLSWAGTCPLKSAPSCEDLDPIQRMVPWIHVSQLPRRHLDGFSRFAQLSSPVYPTYRQTHKQTDHATRDICSNRPHLICTACRRCGLRIVTRTIRYPCYRHERRP